MTLAAKYRNPAEWPLIHRFGGAMQHPPLHVAHGLPHTWAVLVLHDRTVVLRRLKRLNRFVAKLRFVEGWTGGFPMLI